MNKTRLYWICQIGGWSVYGMSQLFFYKLAERHKGENFVDSDMVISTVVMVLASILYTHLFRNLIIKWGWLKRFVRELIPKIILAGVLLSVLIYATILLTIYLLGDLNVERDLGVFPLLVNIFGFTILFIFWTMIYLMYHYVESYNQSLRYEAFINEIRLNKLKSQLNPHFIFNGLNSIRALVDEDPSKAKNAITQLSNILRNSLIMDKQRVINFNDELRTVKDYLDLEQIRFEERLETELMIDPDSNQFRVPPMMIQTLVENGIKHGISNRIDGGKIEIQTTVDAGTLGIRIRNSGQYVNGKTRKDEGYGIQNTIQRLKLIYNDKATFNISNENEETVLTEITIPKIV